MLLLYVYNEQYTVHINYLCDYFALNADDLITLKDQTRFMQFIEAIVENEPTLATILNEFLNNKSDFINYIEVILKEIAGIESFDDELTEEDRKSTRLNSS